MPIHGNGAIHRMAYYPIACSYYPPSKFSHTSCGLARFFWEGVYSMSPNACNLPEAHVTEYTLVLMDKYQAIIGR